MQNSLAIIQPSSFEGWSTVVEDAKALNQNIIVSDIAVHREQLPGHSYFFMPTDFVNLGRYMEEFSSLGKKPDPEVKVRPKEWTEYCMSRYPMSHIH